MDVRKFPKVTELITAGLALELCA